MSRIFTFVVFICALSATIARSDVVRKDTGAVIPGTEGITPGPGVDLSVLDLSFAALNSRNLTGL